MLIQFGARPDSVTPKYATAENSPFPERDDTLELFRYLLNPFPLPL